MSPYLNHPMRSLEDARIANAMRDMSAGKRHRLALVVQVTERFTADEIAHAWRIAMTREAIDQDQFNQGHLK